MLKNAFNRVAGMESMALFAEISGVQPKFASVQYNEVRTSARDTNSNARNFPRMREILAFEFVSLAAHQVYNMVDMVCAHSANQNRGKGFRENFALFLPRFQAITCLSV